MRFTRLKLENWRNFRDVDVALPSRAFIIGPNASGKSNLLDALRFLRDIAEPEGGFQRAIADRGGVSQIRCLHARSRPSIGIEVEVEQDDTRWGYRLEIAQDNRRRPQIKREVVKKNGRVVLERPDRQDTSDAFRLTQTHLEQVNENRQFRPLVDFLAQIRYLHIVPQLVRDPARASPVANDPFGTDFLERLARTPAKTLNARLRRINRALQVAVPQLKELKLERDERGVPHLKGLYEHWRPKAGWQSEVHFSDGTLRLLGLLWALLDGRGPLLLEEPELSLHTGVVRHIPSMMRRVGQKTSRQILVSTHSADLLSDEGIAPEEVLILEPSEEATRVYVAAEQPEIRAMHEAGLSVGEAAFPRTSPPGAIQLPLWY